MRARLVLCLAAVLDLGACVPSDDDGSNCACTVSVNDASLNLACGAQGCLAGMSYGCEEDEVVPISVCGLDLATEPVRNDAGVGICLPARSNCAMAALPCCTTDAGTAPTCDPTTLLCCVATGSPCTTSNDCCDGRSCVSSSAGDVCGS